MYSSLREGVDLWPHLQTALQSGVHMLAEMHERMSAWVLRGEMLARSAMIAMRNVKLDVYIDTVRNYVMSFAMWEGAM